MTGPGILDDLTTQLTDFLGLPGDLDLPRLCGVTLARTEHDPTWRAEAQLSSYYGTDVWAAIHDWQVATGGTVQVGAPYRASRERPWRSVSVTVSCAGLEVRVWGHVDADDEIPAWAQPECLYPALTGTDRAGRVAAPEVLLAETMGEDQ